MPLLQGVVGHGELGGYRLHLMLVWQLDLFLLLFKHFVVLLCLHRVDLIERESWLSRLYGIEHLLGILLDLASILICEKDINSWVTWLLHMWYLTVMLIVCL